MPNKKHSQDCNRILSFKNTLYHKLLNISHINLYTKFSLTLVVQKISLFSQNSECGYSDESNSFVSYIFVDKCLLNITNIILLF